MSESQSRLTTLNTVLKQWGWTDAWLKRWNDLFPSSERVLQPARVLAEQRDYLEVMTGQGPARAEIKGRLRKKGETRPTVGDWVALDENGLVDAILPRQNCLRRKAAGETEDVQFMAANIDWIFVTTSLNKDFNPRRIERFLVAARDSADQGPAAKVALIFTKSDLGLLEIEEARLQMADRLKDIEVIATSSKNGEGVEALKAMIAVGQTAVFLGTSGVGKSSLVNALLQTETQRVNEAREDDDKGRHTTTGRHSFLIPNGGVIIDSPGIRELQFADANTSVNEEFSDIEELALKCKFTNCRHEKEKGCAIRAALESGELSDDRLFSYRKLKSELEAKSKRRPR